VVIFTYNCMFCFSILVSIGSKKGSLVWCTSKLGVACNPMLHSQHLYFVLVTLFLVEHTQHRILSWMGLVFFILQSEVEIPFPPLVLGPSSMSFWIGSLIILNHKRQEW
jgi:hypothetical protein